MTRSAEPNPCDMTRNALEGSRVAPGRDNGPCPSATRSEYAPVPRTTVSHILREVLDRTEALTGCAVERAYVDKATAATTHTIPAASSSPA